MSIQKNNAKKFLDAHKTQIQYEQQVGFKTEKTKPQKTNRIFFYTEITWYFNNANWYVPYSRQTCQLHKAN